MKYLFLFRHGQTDWNAQKKVMGRTDIPLNDLGESQAKEMGKFIEKYTIDRVYSSPQLRALQTAQHIMSSKSLPIQIDDRLAEIDFKRWVGHTAQDLALDPLYEERKKNIAHFHHPEVEGLPSVFKRVREWVQDIDSQTSDNETVAMVTHADIVKIALTSITGLSEEKCRQFRITNASLTVLLKEQNEWFITLVNYSPNVDLESRI